MLPAAMKASTDILFALLRHPELVSVILLPIISMLIGRAAFSYYASQARSELSGRDAGCSYIPIV